VPNLKEVDAIRHLDPIEPPHTFIRLSIIGAPSGTHGSSTLDQAPNIQHWLVPVVREAGAARQLLGAVRFGDATELLGELVSANPESTPAWGLLLRTHVSGGDPMGAVEASREWLESGASGAPSAADVQTSRRPDVRTFGRREWRRRLLVLDAGSTQHRVRGRHARVPYGPCGRQRRNGQRRRSDYTPRRCPRSC